MTARPVPFTCPSCTCTLYAIPEEGEQLFQTKAKLRIQMGAQCTRGADTAKVCPMKERASARTLERA